MAKVKDKRDVSLLAENDYKQFIEASTIAKETFLKEMKRSITEDDESKRKAAIEAKTRAADAYYGMFVLEGKMADEMEMRKGDATPTTQRAQRQPTTRERPIEGRSAASLDDV